MLPAYQIAMFNTPGYSEYCCLNCVANNDIDKIRFTQLETWSASKFNKKGTDDSASLSFEKSKNDEENVFNTPLDNKIQRRLDYLEEKIEKVMDKKINNNDTNGNQTISTYAAIAAKKKYKVS